MNYLKSIVGTLLLAMLITLNVNAQSGMKGKTLTLAINNYLALKDALANSNGDDAEAKAKVLLATLNEWPASGQTGAELALIAKLKYDSRHISEVNRIAHQREHFGSLSKNLISLIKTAKLNQTMLYLEQSSAQKMYFLSGKDTTKDPYTGQTQGIKLKEKIPVAKM
jgi:hypothetical protein